jgi:nucleotide-binding universal stress UspA family protein
MLLERIVVGVDFGPASLAAARWAAQCLAPEAEIVLVHCVSPTKAATVGAESATSRARHRLEALRQELGPVRTQIEVSDGNPAMRIAEAAGRLDADLIVVGPHNHHPQTADKVGSTADELVHRSCTPVLLATGELRGPPRRLLLPVQGPDISAFVFEWARAIEARCDARISIVHIDVAPCYRETTETASGDQAPRWRRVADGFEPNTLFVDAVKTNEPADTVMSQAQRFSSDLVVLGDRTFGADSPPAIRRILLEARRPVLVVPDAAR